MKKELTYNEAFITLQDLVAQLEDGGIQLDQLSVTVKQANELIAICEKKLRSIEGSLNDGSSKT